MLLGRTHWSGTTSGTQDSVEIREESLTLLIFYSAVVDSKNLWSGFPNPLLPPLTHPGGLENPPQTTNNAGAFDRLVCFEFLGELRRLLILGRITSALRTPLFETSSY